MLYNRRSKTLKFFYDSWYFVEIGESYADDNFAKWTRSAGAWIFSGVNDKVIHRMAKYKDMGNLWATRHLQSFPSQFGVKSKMLYDRTNYYIVNQKTAKFDRVTDKAKIKRLFVRPEDR